MRATSNVSFDGISGPMLQALAIAESLHKEMTGQSMTVISVNDGTHPTGSRHYAGEAADIRIWVLDRHGRTKDFAIHLAGVLGSDYRVMYGDEYRVDQIHVEYNPLMGRRS